MSGYRGKPVKSGDNFWSGPTRFVVTRVSRDPQHPWVDVEVYPGDRAEDMWTKRLPQGIPTEWDRVGGTR